jgi:hypothetical protein
MRAVDVCKKYVELHGEDDIEEVHARGEMQRYSCDE